MTEPWREVAETCLGWLHSAEGPALQDIARLATALHPGIPMVEIGGYAGKSSCWLGSMAKEAGTILYSVDWHRGSPEMAPDRECYHPEMVGTDGLFDSLPHFRANIRRAGLEPWVVPVAGASGIVGRLWSTPMSLLFIDGGHDGETVDQDFRLWSGNVANGGYLLFHDTPIPEIDGVASAAVATGLFTFVRQVDSLRILQRQ